MSYRLLFFVPFLLLFFFFFFIVFLTLYRLKLKSFQKFDNATTALEEVASLVEGKVTPRLASLLDQMKDEKKASLAVADPKLGMAYHANFSVPSFKSSLTDIYFCFH